LQKLAIGPVAQSMVDGVRLVLLPISAALLVWTGVAVAAVRLPLPGEAPRPTPRPTAALDTDPALKDDKQADRVPTVRPAGKAKLERRSRGGEKQAEIAAPGAPIVMPAEDVACRDRLRVAKVEFAEEAPLSDPLGCSVPFPIRLRDLGPDFGLEPEAVLNCAMAEKMVEFTREVIAPAATVEFETRLKRLRHASAYVCRPRHGSQRLSEHAYGNALDISHFILEDGTEIAVDATREPARSIFLSKIRTAACGPFKTVLGPGSDADHAKHFHFDLAKRRTGGTFCQ
jgi:hypothetical protein